MTVIQIKFMNPDIDSHKEESTILKVWSLFRSTKLAAPKTIEEAAIFPSERLPACRLLGDASTVTWRQLDYRKASSDNLCSGLVNLRVTRKKVSYGNSVFCSGLLSPPQTKFTKSATSTLQRTKTNITRLCTAASSRDTLAWGESASGKIFLRWFPTTVWATFLRWRAISAKGRPPKFKKKNEES